MGAENYNLKLESIKEALYEILERKLNISKEVFLSKLRTRPLADSRRVMMRILKNHIVKLKVREIGDAVARDHSSVSTQLKEHEKLYNSNRDYTNLFDLINSELDKSISVNKSLIDLYKDKVLLEDKLETVKASIEEMESQPPEFYS